MSRQSGQQLLLQALSVVHPAASQRIQVKASNRSINNRTINTHLEINQTVQISDLIHKSIISLRGFPAKGKMFIVGADLWSVSLTVDIKGI